jgi:flagellar hook-associated protein 2
MMGMGSSSIWGSSSQSFQNNMLGGFMSAPPGISWNSSPSGFSSSVMNVRGSAESLRQTLRNIIGNTRGTSSPFGANTPVSANTDALRITSFDTNRLRNTKPADFSVEVRQVAKAQVNSGANMSSSDLAVNSGFSAGENKMSLQIGSQQFDFSFNVSETDTNKDVQQRIASAVNNRNIGVTASVDSSTAGTGALVLQSRQTGVTNAGQQNFSVSGSAADSAGVGSATQAAQNAEFRVNRSGFTGAMQTSRSNDVELLSGIKGQLREVGTTKVNMTRDSQSQMDSFKDLLNSFNSFLRTARDNSAGGRPSRLEQQLMGLARSYSAGLSSVGVTANRDGTLQVNESRMKTAAQNGALERFVGDGGNRSNIGFVNRLERTVDSAIRNPGTLLGNVGNTSSLANNNRQFLQMYSLLNTGMLFNAFF